MITLFRSITLLWLLLNNTTLQARIHHHVDKDSISEIERESPYIHTPIHIHFDGSLSIAFMHGHEGTRGLEYSISPIILLNGDKIKRLVKLGEQDRSELTPQMIPTNAQGYRLIRKKTFDIGFGLAPHAGILELVAGLGIMGHKGHSKYYERYVESIEDAKKKPPLAIPFSPTDLRKWEQDDQLIFAYIGGVSFHLFLGFDPFIFIGPAYRAMGEWKIHLEKIARNKIKYNIVNEKIKLFGMEAEGGFTKLDVEDFHTKEKYFTFTFDLSKPQAVEAFKDVLHGNIKSAQKLSENPQAGVETLVQGVSKSRGSIKANLLSLPFLYGNSSSRNRVINSSFEHDLENGFHIKTNVALLEHRSATFGRLSKHKLGADFFIANHEQSLPNKNIQKGLSFEEVGVIESKRWTHQFGGTYKWVYESDNVSGEKIEHKLDSLRRQTGFKSLDFQFPHEYLGYTRLEFSIMFNQGFLVKILKICPNGPFYQNLLTAITKDIDLHFKQGDSNLCKNKSRSSCKQRFIKDSKKQVQTLARIIEKMQITFSQNRYQKFINSYAKLGKIVTSNQFILQNILKKLQGAAVEFELMGEKYQYFKKIIDLPKNKEA